MTYEQNCIKKTEEARRYFDDLENILKAARRRANYWQLLKPTKVALAKPTLVSDEECPSFKNKPKFEEIPIEQTASFPDRPVYEAKLFFISPPVSGKKWER